ncbi:TonB-dependent receptor [Rurimicrobium arvi]|uniref:Carboxypeptidase regulatory-like domain-containing protein n=1 Tax=Rurimicrobium arvi TaxID=2049916 RepID=A0ABP8MSA4_9BACT
MKFFIRLTALMLSVFIAHHAAYAQETTATLSGSVRDDQKKPIEAATILLIHEPTGTVSDGETNNRGNFIIPNLKPGGPYTLKITYLGHNEERVENLTLNLGENAPVDIMLHSTMGKELKEVQISGRKAAGGGTTVSRQQIAVLPTLGRSLGDFTRLTPQSNNNSFAGTSFRYNNITMDGAINNDAIGFSNSFGGQSGGGQAGTAGAGTRTNPYSLDAIQEVQVQLAPYDVKLGNFTGGSVNAVTKSGTNEFQGDVYSYGRNAAIVGKSPDSRKTSLPSSFYDYQSGTSVGGAIVKNKLFYFLNGEITRRQEPTFYNAGDPGSAISVADAQKIVDKLKSQYNYDPGTYNATNIQTNSNKVFARLDYNINSKNTLMFRTIYTDGSGQNLERTTTNFQFSSTDFTQHTKNLNTVAELKSTLNNHLFNSLIMSYVNVHEYRDFPGQLAPFIDIGGGQVWLGTWREASIYNMRQKTIELTDNATWIKGIHKFTFGTHNEFYKINYGFINSWNGRWEYANLNAFLADQPSRIRGAYSFDASDNSRSDLYNITPGGTFNVNLMSAYAQDELSLAKNLKLTPGLRIDYAGLPKQPSTDTGIAHIQEFISASGQSSYTHTPFSSISNKWLNNVMVSPRVGFNWDVKGNKSVIVRGGSGIFTGRMPFAWLGYAYTLSGANYGTIDYKPGGKTVGLSMNPSDLRDTVGKYGGSSASATRELDLVDNNFHLPTVWRSNVATDIKLGKGYKLTVDVMYTKTIYDVKFQQINIKDTFTTLGSGPSQTPVYLGGKESSQYSNVYLLSNTTQGYRYNVSAQLSRTWSDVRLGNHPMNIFASAAYTYGQSRDIANGIRNSFQSNYEVNPAVSPENPTLAYSNFDIRHRIVSVASASLKWNERNSSSLSFFYSGTSGSPYSMIYTSSPNAFNNSSNATLVYIPKDASDIRLADIKDASGNVTYSAAQQSADLQQFINGDKYLSAHRGEYAERNGLRTPWNHELDMKLMHTWSFRVSEHRSNSVQLSLDIFNVLNLLNNAWGHQYFVTNVNNYTVNFLTAVTDAKGTAPGKANYDPTYTFVKPPFNGQYYTVDPISSRYQMQLGVKYNF